ncbi:MAG: LLM class flavin-dependent oxidoreductase [Acidimicrobiales bacterium]
MARDLNFGIWYDLRNPDPWAIPFGDLYSGVLDQIAWAEGQGFGSVWLTEHHFIPDGYTPSPLVIAAAIGERTRSMRIGTNLMLMPLHDPVRLAEDAATLSLLTGGRFDLGLGLGYRQIEFDEFGRSLKNRPSLLEEGVEVLRRAWTGEPINFSGKRFQVGDVAVTPVPEVTPKIFIGGMAEPAIQRAARIGDGFLSTGGIGQDVYVAALEAEGRAGVICAGNWAIVAEDPEAEAAKVGDHVLYQINEYVKWGAFGPPEQIPQFPDAPSAIENGLYELWDADAAVENLTAMLQQFPQVVDVHFWAKFPGEPIDSGTARLAYLAENVLPRVRANLG